MNDTTQSNPQSLTVQEGRLYMTRRGRLVGPVVPNRGITDVFGNPRKYPWIIPARVGVRPYSVTHEGRCNQGLESPNDLVLEVADDAVSVAPSEEPAPTSAPPAPDPKASAPAATDIDLLAAVLDDARREAVAMTARHAPTTIAIARIVGRGYPLGDAMHAIAAADQMAFAGLRQQAVDMLSEAIVALAVASVMIQEGRE